MAFRTGETKDRWQAIIVNLFVIVTFLSSGVKSQNSMKEALSSFYAAGELVSAPVETCNVSNIQFSVDSGIFFEEFHYNDGPGGKVNKTLFRIKDGDFITDFGREMSFMYGSSACTLITNETIERFDLTGLGSDAFVAPMYTILSELQARTLNRTEGRELRERGFPAILFEIDLDEHKANDIDIEYAALTFKDYGQSDIDLSKIVPMVIDICSVDANGGYRRNRFSIVNFLWNSTDEAKVSPPAGVFCPGYGSDDLPDLFSNARAMVFQTELYSPLKGVISSDVAIDFERNLLRIDDFQNSYFYSHSQGNVSWRVRTAECGLIYNVVNDGEHAGMCNIIESKNIDKFNWTFVDFTTRNVTDFFGVAHGFTVKTKVRSRGIECQIVHGMRNDYPASSSRSLWEWCIASVKAGTEMITYPVHLDIFYDSTNAKNGTHQCHRESYALYNVGSFDPRDVYHEQFTGLENCFESENIHLQVTINVTERDVDDSQVEFAMKSIEFRARFLDRLLNASGVSPDTYRFGTPHVIVSTTGRFAVFQFLLFGNKNESEPSLSEVRKRLEETINTNSSDIEDEINNIKFQIQPHSLVDAVPVVEPDIPTTTDAPVTTSSTTPRPETTTLPDLPPEVRKGHSLLTLILSALGLFIVGSGIGAIVARKLPNFFSLMPVSSSN